MEKVLGSVARIGPEDRPSVEFTGSETEVCGADLVLFHGTSTGGCRRRSHDGESGVET